MPVLPDMPAPLSDLVGALVGVVCVLFLVAAVVGGATLLRRAVRHYRISGRLEGWGSPGHPNQRLPDEDGSSHPVLDLLKALTSSSGNAAPSADGAPGERDPRE